uniref:hypothetical protein n=1 Tax=Ningiella ruwaisensis TaxID=2364274 RepID=UPI00109FD058|nr:hypothetical protein [Ningiella ruwaisensis]
MQLTDQEKEALSLLCAGQPVVGSKTSDKEKAFHIRSSFFRTLLLQLPIEGKVYSLPRCGIKLENVFFQGRLQLDEMTGVGHDALTSLTFKRCWFEGGLSANNTNLQSLRLHHSCFNTPKSSIPSICLDNSNIKGTCNLSNISGFDSQQYCRVSARNCKIDGSLLLTDSHLLSEFREHKPTKASFYYALNLSNAEIKGDIESKLGLWANGGISLKNAKIGGDIWLLGARLDAREEYALNLQGMHCKGSLVIRPVYEREKNFSFYSYLHGPIHAYSMKVDGGCYIEGVYLGKHPFAAVRNQKRFSIGASKSVIGDSLVIAHYFLPNAKIVRTVIEENAIFESATVNGLVNFIGVKVNASINMSKCSIGGKVTFTGVKGDEYFMSEISGGMHLNSSVLSATLSLFGVSIEQDLDLVDSYVKGYILIRGLFFDNDEKPYFPSLINRNLLLSRACINSYVSLLGVIVKKRFSAYYAEIKGNIECGSELTISLENNSINNYCFFSEDVFLDNAVVDGSLIFESIRVQGSLTANYSKICKNVVFSSKSTQINERSEIGGGLFLGAAKIGGCVSLNGLTVDINEHPSKRGIYLKMSEVEGYVELVNISLKTQFDASYAKVGSDITISLATERNSFIESDYPNLLLKYMVVQGHLKIMASAHLIDIELSEVAKNVQILGEVRDKLIGKGSTIGGDFELNRIAVKPKQQQELEADSEGNRHIFNLSNMNINGALKVLKRQVAKTEQEIPVKSWFKALDCYPDYFYVETLLNRPDGGWTVSFLVSRDAFNDHLLNSTIQQNTYLFNTHSIIFHELNADGKLDISSKRNAQEYIRLFCGSVWGDEGAFTVVESLDELPLQHLVKHSNMRPENIIVHPLKNVELDSPLASGANRIIGPEDKFLFRGFIFYGCRLFESLILLKNNGNIEIVEDIHRMTFEEEVCPQFLVPLREYRKDLTKNSNFVISPENDLSELSAEQQLRFHPVALKRLVDALANNGLASAAVDLSNTKCKNLDDNAGRDWGAKVSFKLRNFTYDSFVLRQVGTHRTFLHRIRQHSIWRAKFFRAKVLRFSGKLLSQRQSAKINNLGKKILEHSWSTTPIKPRYASEQNKKRIKSRIHWLMRQFELKKKPKVVRMILQLLNFIPFISFSLYKRHVNSANFSIQPFNAASAAFRREGVKELAREIDVVARYYAGMTNASDSGGFAILRYPLHILYGLSSKFGLSPILVFVWISLMILVGGIMTSVAAHKGLLQSQVHNYSAYDKSQSETVLNYQKVNDAMGEYCRDNLSPTLYAADKFIPLINLGQTDRCAIYPIKIKSSIINIAPQRHSIFVDRISAFVPSTTRFWAWFYAAYVLLGWVMLSLFIFTLSYRLMSYRSESKD